MFRRRIYFLSQDADCSFGIDAIHNCKTRGKAQMGSIFSQDRVAKRVKGAAGHLAASAIQQLGGPLQHLLGGLASECQKKNRRRGHAFFHQSGHPIGQGACFSAAGSRNYE